jgi:hypothetical protein
LDELFKGMQSSGLFGDSIIIVHGDHGGRLGIRAPVAKMQAELRPVDFADGLATLYATKIPGKPGGYHHSLYTINDLFVQTLRNAFGQTPPFSVPRREPFAYLNNGHRKQMLLVDMSWRPMKASNSSAAVQ